MLQRKRVILILRHLSHFVLSISSKTKKFSGWQGESESKGACCQAQGSIFNNKPKICNGKKESIFYIIIEGIVSTLT